MKKIVVLFLSCCSFSVFAKSSIEEEIQKISPGWEIKTVVSGDLNHTGEQYAAAILFQKNPNKKNVIDPDDIATLRIYFRDKNGGLYIKKDAPKSICVDCGGVKGGRIPYDLDIKNSAILLTYFGGSREFSSIVTKWRYQNNDFYLIGISDKTQDSFSNGPGSISSITRDANILTLKMTENIQYFTDKSGQAKKLLKIFSCPVSKSYQEIILGAKDDISTPTCTDQSL